MTWSPYRLPRIRRQIARAHDQAGARYDQLVGRGDYARTAAAAGVDPTRDLGRDMRQLADQYRAADLYWVTPQMARVALDASADLPAWTPVAARPASFGLLVWDGGLPRLPWRGAPEAAWTVSPFGRRVPPTAQVDGIMWSPDPAGIRIGILTRTDLLGSALSDQWADAPLFAFADLVLTLDKPARADGYEGLVAAIGATWLLMQQSTVAETRPLHDGDGHGAGGRPPRPDKQVSIIDLRRARQQAGRDDGDEPGDGRVYTRRWLVRGHWRQQAVGAGRARRRPTWVPSYIKGPDGAPLLETEHVQVWRR